jgi:hypothetical protein
MGMAVITITIPNTVKMVYIIIFMDMGGALVGVIKLV